MSLLDDSCEFDAQLDFEPLVRSSEVAGMSTPTRPTLPSPAAQETPFTAALRAFSSSTAPPVPPLHRAFSAATPSPVKTPEVLVDFAPTPSPRPFGSLTQPQPPPSPSPRSPSPLKQVSFNLSGDIDDDEREHFQSPFARDVPGTARKLGRVCADADEGEAVSPTTRRASGGGRKWSVMSKVRDEQRRARSRSVSPVKDAGSSLAPVLEDAESSFIFSQFGNTSDEYSLIVDERGSFLVDSADFTLASFSLPSVAEADEANSTADMSHLLRGLGDSLIGGRPPPRLGVVPTLHEKASTESLFPTAESPVERSLLASSTASYRDYRDSPSKPRPLDFLHVPSTQPKASIDSLIAPDNPAESTTERSFLASSTASYHDHRVKPAYSTDSLRSVVGDRSLLASSTASYVDHRDSPAKGRVASFAFDNDRTPVRLQKDQMASGSGSSGGSTDDVRNLLRDWRDDGGSTSEINDQDPPTGVLKPEPTLTFEMGLQSPIRPSTVPRAALSPKALSGTLKFNSQRPLQRTMVASSSSPNLISLDATPASVKPILARSESGTDRLRKKIEELNKKRQAPLPVPILPTALPSSAPRSRPSSSTRVPPTTRTAPSSAPRALTRPRPSLSALPPPRLTHRRLDSIPDTEPESGTDSAKENAPPPAPRKPATPGNNSTPRKEATRDRLERAKEEREQRQRRGPVLASASTSRPPPASLADALARPRPTSLASRSQFNPLGTSRTLAPLPIKPSSANIRTAPPRPRTSLLPAPSSALKPRSSLLPAPPRQSILDLSSTREPSPTKPRALRRPSVIGLGSMRG